MMEPEVAGPVLVPAAVCKPPAPGGSQLGALPAQKDCWGACWPLCAVFWLAQTPSSPVCYWEGREAVALCWEQEFGGAAETEAAGKSRHGLCTQGWGGLTGSRVGEGVCALWNWLNVVLLATKY